MKTKFLLFLLYSFLSLVLTDEVRAQFTRGHNSDDLYLTGIIDSQFQQALFRFTNHGAEMQVINAIDFNNFDSTLVCLLTYVVPDISEGNVYCIDRYNGTPIPFSISFNYGQTWANCQGIPENGFDLASGSRPGEVYLRTKDPDNSLYFSDDYGYSFDFIRPLTTIKDIEVGTDPGELYIVKNNMLLHSLNNGLDFDTIMIDTAIVNNHGIKKLSRGTQSGELYLFTQSGYVNHRIYKSNNYGHYFNLIFDETIEPGNSFLFTAGRDSCSFYIARIEWDGENSLYTIEHSNDCGQSFIAYNHLVTGSNSINFETGISVFPNPAKGYIVFQGRRNIIGKILVTDLFGKTIFQFPINGQSITFNTSSLNPGIYLYKFEGNGTVSSGKFIIMR